MSRRLLSPTECKEKISTLRKVGSRENTPSGPGVVWSTDGLQAWLTESGIEVGHQSSAMYSAQVVAPLGAAKRSKGEAGVRVGCFWNPILHP